jgi:membrane-associated phospholipid phosphatase
MDTILNLGIPWNIFLQNLGSWLKTPMEFFSFLGTEYFFLFLLPALYWCVEAGTGVRVGIMLLLGSALNDALKLSLHGPRPYWVSSQVIDYARETSFGAPSGHAQIAVGIWGMLAYRLRRAWGWLIAILVIVLIAVSRLYLGVHFPFDVILGLLVGALLLWLVIRFWKPVTAWLEKLSLGQKILAAFLASLLLLLLSVIPFLWLKTTNWQPAQAWAQFATGAVTLSGPITNAGTLFGLLAGLAWINQRGGFDASGPFWKRLLRFLLGVAGVLVFYVGLDVVFGLIAPDAEAILPYLLRFIRYSLVGAWVSACAPWFFIRLGLAGKA